MSKLDENKLHFFTKTFEFEREIITMEFISTDQSEIPSIWEVTSKQTFKGYLLWSQYKYGWDGYNTLFESARYAGERINSDGTQTPFMTMPYGIKIQIANALDEHFDNERGKLHF